MTTDDFITSQYVEDAGDTLNAEYLEEVDRQDFEFRDVWNPLYNPNKTQINTTGIELDVPHTSNQIVTDVSQSPQAQETQIQPKFFHQESGRLIMSPGFAKKISHQVFQEVQSNLPGQVKDFASAAKRLMTGLHLKQNEIDGWVRHISPTLAELYDEFISLKKSDEDILDFASAVSTILNDVLKLAA